MADRVFSSADGQTACTWTHGYRVVMTDRATDADAAIYEAAVQALTQMTEADIDVDEMRALLGDEAEIERSEAEPPADGPTESMRLGQDSMLHMMAVSTYVHARLVEQGLIGAEDELPIGIEGQGEIAAPDAGGCE